MVDDDARHRLPTRLETTRPVCVLTGATRGIGRLVADAVVQRGHALVVLGRSAQRSEQLCVELAEVAGHPEVFWVPCDLSSLSSVKAAAEVIAAAVPVIDVLINNAGHYGAGFEETDDGFERHLAVNYLAPFVLTHLLLPSLRTASAARVVNVAGETARIGRIRLDDLDRRERFSVLGAYAQSKLAMLLFTRVLSVAVADSPMLVNAMQPGLAATGHLASGPRWLQWLWKTIAPRPARAARAVAALALDPNREGTSGRYYWGRFRAVPPLTVYRDTLARALYAKTLDLVGLPPHLALRRASEA